MEKNPQYVKAWSKSTRTTFDAMFFSLSWFPGSLAYFIFVCVAPIFTSISCWCAVDKQQQHDQHKRMKTRTKLEMKKFHWQCVFLFSTSVFVVVRLSQSIYKFSFNQLHVIHYQPHHVILRSIHPSALWLNTRICTTSDRRHAHY